MSRDRPAGAKLLETLGVDAIIMDDGFQNPSLKKDLSVAVVDGGAGIGCGRVFPLGPLRARLAFQLAMADAVVILGAQDRTNVAELIEQRSQQFRSTPLPVFSARIVPAVRDELRGRPFLAFCGIGRPAKFFDTLREAGIAVVKTRSFPDHHAFSDADARSLLTEANALNAGLITTEKDHARLRGENGPARGAFPICRGPANRRRVRGRRRSASLTADDFIVIPESRLRLSGIVTIRDDDLFLLKPLPLQMTAE